VTLPYSIVAVPCIRATALGLGAGAGRWPAPETGPRATGPRTIRHSGPSQLRTRSAWVSRGRLTNRICTPSWWRSARVSTTSRGRVKNQGEAGEEQTADDEQHGRAAWSGGGPTSAISRALRRACFDLASREVHFVHGRRARDRRRAVPELSCRMGSRRKRRASAPFQPTRSPSQAPSRAPPACGCDALRLPANDGVPNRVGGM